MNDGGPAFPGLKFEFDEQLQADAQWPYAPVPFGGMSIRDYFAGQALPAFLQCIALTPTAEIKEFISDQNLPADTPLQELAAKMSYATADVMLVEREKKGDE